MGHDGLRGRASAVVLLSLVAGATAIAVVAPRHRAVQPLSRPLLVALAQSSRGSELVSIDPRRMRVVRRTRLRSLCLSIAASGRRVVTAQCGGPDTAADRVAGIYTPDTGRIDYIDLGVQNPLDVAANPTRALIVHGLEQEGRLLTSVVDLRSLSVTHTTAGSGALKPEADGPAVLVPEVEVGESPTGAAPVTRLVALGGGRSPSVTATLSATWCRIVTGGSPTSGKVRLIVRRHGRASEASGSEAEWSVVTVHGVGTGAKLATVRLPELEYGCADACMWRGMIAVADADGIDMARPGDTVRVFDAETGDERLRIPLKGGMPAALAEWHGRLFVADGVTGDVYAFDARGHEVGRAGVGAVPVGAADLLVLR